MPPPHLPALLALLLLLPPAALARAPPDYIIVGSGAGGCTIAARLCALLPHRQFVLLERGARARTPHDELLLRAPREGFRALSSRFAEALKTAPNPGLGGRAVTVFAGNALGGLSAVIPGQWTVPPAAQVARWGLRGLTRRRARHLFARAARKVRPAVPPPALRQRLAGEWLAAAARAGLPPLRGKQRLGRAQGVFNNSVAVDRRGRRRDACTAYLAPALAGRCRGNLRVVTGAAVTKVLLSKRRGRRKCGGRGPPRVRRQARGVEYRVGAMRRRLRARRAVIVAAGPIGSPLLLQASGVGPRAVLRAAGVPLREALPVGVGVRSRVVGTVVSLYRGMATVEDNVRQVVRSADVVAQFRAGRGGVLGRAVSSINGRFGKEFLLTGSNSFDLDDPAGRDQPLLLSGCLGTPTADGRIEITGADAAARPRLALNYLGGKGDAGRMARCLRKLRAVHAQLDGRLQAVEVRPGAAVEKIDAAAARANALSGFHVVGGCAVGRVVDGEFGVRGVDGLRVVDSSVMPEMPRQAGPLASVYMLAELGAELVASADRC